MWPRFLVHGKRSRCGVSSWCVQCVCVCGAIYVFRRYIRKPVPRHVQLTSPSRRWRRLVVKDIRRARGAERKREIALFR